MSHIDSKTFEADAADLAKTGDNQQTSKQTQEIQECTKDADQEDVMLKLNHALARVDSFFERVEPLDNVISRNKQAENFHKQLEIVIERVQQLERDVSKLKQPQNMAIEEKCISIPQATELIVYKLKKQRSRKQRKANIMTKLNRALARIDTLENIADQVKNIEINPDLDEHCETKTDKVKLLENATDPLKHLEILDDRVEQLESVAKRDKRFENIDIVVTELERVADRFKKLDGLPRLTEQLNNVTGRVVQLESVAKRDRRLENACKIVDELERGVVSHNSQLDIIKQTNKQLDGVTDRAKHVEYMVDQVQKLKGVMAKRIRELDCVDDLIKEYTAATSRIKQLESMACRVEELEGVHKSNKTGLVNECYTNWNCSHDNLTDRCYVSIVELKDTLWKLSRLSFRSAKDRNQMRKMLYSLFENKIFKINKMSRFPADKGRCVDIKSQFYYDPIEIIYQCLGDQDEIDRAKELGDEMNVTSSPFLRLKAHTSVFIDLINRRDAARNMDSHFREFMLTSEYHHTVESFEETFALKWA